MEAFLQQISNTITKENLPYLYTRCYIFPTKRATIYFTDFLKKKYPEENFILPETITIQDFIANNSSFIIKDDWYLLLELYQIQSELTHIRQPLEKFLPWGKMILKDFDECDKYLIDAKKLFSVLKAHKETEETFSISEETRKYIEQFILTSSSKEKESIYKDNFIKTWALLGDMYLSFKEKLKANNFAFEGMAYREVYDNLKLETLKLPYTEISFCGFNALSLCEEEIFKIIEQQYNSTFFWDADEYFLENKLHEAGNFLRIYQQKFANKNSQWIIKNELEKGKHIQIVGVSSNIGQTQYIAQQKYLYTNEKTAIVLCDENLLNPLMYNIDVSNVNITMGYSISQSELYLFTNALLNFYGNTRVSENNTAYYHKDIATLIQHPYFKNKIVDIDKLESILPFFVPYFPEEILSEFFSKEILISNLTATKIIETVLKIIEQTNDNDNYFIPIKVAIIEQLKSLAYSLNEKIIDLNKNALSFIVKQFLSSIKIPFEKTDNIKDINTQIMGFLETRILDFENLFIVSLNDDNLPGTNKTNSFIPYNLRKGFGLPTFEEFDGINAYHFYRLLKRAKNIHLIYNNQVGDNMSEKSRFIRQIQHDLATKDNIINEYVAVIDDNKLDESLEANNILQVKKTPAIIELLRQRAFSPSALKVYIKCPLQFYLKYVEKIDEPTALEEEIDAAIFGQILHKALELIYQPYINTVITNKKIDSFTESIFIAEKIKEACVALELPKEITQGSNKLQLKIIEQIAQKIIKNDSAENELIVLKTEEKFIWKNLKLDDGTFAIIQGTFDRIDKVGEKAIRIIDYKTGTIELPIFPDDDDENIQAFLDIIFIFEKKDYSATFQGILYALMYYKLYDCHEIYIGFHHAKNMKDGIAYLNNQQPISIYLLQQFENRLSTLMSNLIYKDEFFTQTINENAYQYSIYADMLGLN